MLNQKFNHSEALRKPFENERRNIVKSHNIAMSHQDIAVICANKYGSILNIFGGREQHHTYTLHTLFSSRARVQA